MTTHRIRGEGAVLRPARPEEPAYALSRLSQAAEVTAGALFASSLGIDEGNYSVCARSYRETVESKGNNTPDRRIPASSPALILPADSR
jgi:hypothetical protein